MTRHTTSVVVALLAIAACGGSTDTTAGTRQGTFDEQVAAICRDIVDAAYEDVQALYANGEVTASKQAAEYRIRADAVDALVDEMSLVTPTEPLADVWLDVLAELSGYAAASRDLADSIDDGGQNSGVDHPGLDRFRGLRLGGGCSDWLDMN